VPSALPAPRLRRGYSEFVAKKRSTKKTRKVPEARPSVEAPSAPLVDFDSIVGHDRAIEVLQGAIRSKRIHHAWIFQGAQGVGKFTVASALAAVILDPTSVPNMAGVIEADPASETRRLIGAGTHPDLHVVTKELARFSDDARVRGAKLMNIPLDVLRTRVLEPASLAPSVARGALASKVFIIDEAELIDLNGQNALLKTLEEPAPGTVIILVTSQAERLLPTIRSRCQRVAFGPLSEEEMRAWLEREASREDSALRELSESGRAAALSIAEGAPGMAVLAVRTGMVDWPGLIEPKLAELDAGRPAPDLGRLMAELVNGWASAWVEAHDGASKDAANKAGAGHMFRLVASHYRRLLGGGASDRASRAIERVGEAEAIARSNVQGIFVFEDLAASLAETREGAIRPGG